MATTDRTAIERPGLGDRESGRARPGGRRAEWWRGWFTPAQGLRPRPLDVLVALVIAFVQVAGTITYSQEEPPSPWAFDAFACIPLVAGPVALLFRRRWPEATLVVTFAAAAGYAASGYPRGPAGFPAFGFAVASAIMMGRSSFAWRVLVVAYAAFIWLPSLIPDEVEKARGLAGAATNLVWLPLVAAASEIARIRLERRAERAHVAREEARRRASEERLLITRELHDVLAHNISLINVQSGVALHLLDERPEQARPALEAINEASEEALAELHSVLDMLSRGLGEDGAWAPHVPTAGLRDLDGLMRRTRAAGLDVRLAIEGEARSVPAGVDLAALRIVQEALTNVVRHAGGGARATVRLVYAPSELVVQVDDDGRAPTRRRAGRGRRARMWAVASPAWGSGSMLWAARSRPAPAPAGATASGRSSHCRMGRDDPGGVRGTPEGCPDMIRVLLADDQDLVRAGFRALLDAQDDIAVVGEAGDGEEAVQLARRHRPDIVLMDIRMPGTDGLTATRSIAADDGLAEVRIVILTTFELDEYVFEAIRAGASGFIVKHTKPAELLRAVRAVAAGDALLSPSVTRRLIREFAARTREAPPLPALDALTEREREVMGLVAEGLTNDEIAERLVVSPLTAKTHVSRAMVKLGARDRIQLVVFAYESGLVRPGWT